MRTLPRHAHALILLAAAMIHSPAQAEDLRFYNQNTTGLALPGVNLPSGHDEIRAADGTFCRTAVSGNGAYLDTGIIGSGLDGNQNMAGAVYGRVVMPLSSGGRRMDCNELYQLELQRLRAEVEFLRTGAAQVSAPPTAPSRNGGWSQEGWSNQGDWTLRSGQAN